MSFEIPDPRADLAIPGWFAKVAAPAIAEIETWDALDEAEGRLQACAGWIEALGGDWVEFEKALRIVEKRRGELQLEMSLREVSHARDISYQTVERWRKLARHWDDLLWPHLLRESKREKVTQSHLLRLINEHTPAKPDADLPDAESGDENNRLLHGDFRERLAALEPGSVDLILTDPPYSNAEQDLWSDLAQIANKLLSPSGYLLAMSGKIHLDQVMSRLGEHLTFGWIFCWPLPGAASRILAYNIRQTWKPILCYTTGKFSRREPMPDTVPTGAAEKSEYRWQQQEAPARWLIERLTAPTGLVVDPFMGVGSFGAAARAAGRRFIGVELDGGRFRQASERVLI